MINKHWRFKDSLSTIGKFKDYYGYRDTVMRNEAIEWCEEHGGLYI